MALRQIIKSILGNQYGLDKTGNPVWNRNDNVQLVLDVDATTGIAQLITSIPGSSPAKSGSITTRLIGTAAQILAVTPAVGDLAYATDLVIELIGKSNATAGSGTYWAPRGGQQTVYTRTGSIASPLASIASGITAATFTIPGGNPTLPANLLVVGQSRLRIYAHFKRAGSTAASTFNIRLGSAGTTSDNTVYTGSLTAVNLEARPMTEAGISSSTGFTTFGNLQIQTPQAAMASDKTGSSSTASPAIVTVDVSGANVADGPFILISLQVDLLG